MEIDYSSTRNDLESYLTHEDRKQRDIELWVYDSMVKIKDEYESLKDSKKRIQGLLDEASQEPDVEYLEKILDEYKYSKKREIESGCHDPIKMPAPAFIFVLNYDKDSTWHDNHIFNGDWYDEPVPYDTDKAEKELKKIAYQDNAILMDDDGDMLAKRVLLTSLNPKMLLKLNGYDQHSRKDMAKAMGFEDANVNARNKNSLTFSFHTRKLKDNPGTVVYTLAEETGNIRRMESGKITHSTYPNESVYHPDLGDRLRVFFDKLSEYQVEELDGLFATEDFPTLGDGKAPAKELGR